jgi:hypothetical protein
MQELLVAVIIAAALVWLGLRLFRACRSNSCKGCPGCGAKCQPAEQSTDNHDEPDCG